MPQAIQRDDKLNDSPRESYSQKGNPGFEAIMAMRTAQKEGSFLLNELRPGMKLLDAGCGPGSISLGFAETVPDVQVVGVDFQESQVLQARSRCHARGIQNASFEVADAYALPFSEGTFDAVFANALLWHLKEPLRALAEMRRVLRPGGIIGVRDCDWGARICSPMSPLLEEWFEVTIRVRLHNGGNPFLGRELRGLLQDAGFCEPRGSVSAWTAGTPEETRLCGTFLKAQLQGFSSTVLAKGWMDEMALEKVASEIDEWSTRLDAFYLETYCEALAVSRS